MKRWPRTSLLCTLLVLLLTVSAAGCRGREPAVPTQPLSASDMSQPAAPGNIKALGILAPAQQSLLSFHTAGKVDSVSADVGVSVQAGDVLAELDATSLRFELQQARESVALRQAELDALLNGASAALIQRAAAEHDQQVAEAEFAVEVARLGVDGEFAKMEAESQARQQEVVLAEAQLERAEVQLAQAQAQAPNADVIVARVNLTRAQDALEMTRVEYDKAIHRHWEPKEVHDAYARALRHAEQDLQLAQAAFAAAQGAQDVHALSVRALVLQRDAAAAQLTQTLESCVVYSNTVAILTTEAQRAQLQLDGLRAWQNPYLDPAPAADIAPAETLLRQATLTEEQLEWQSNGVRLRAPFDGVVSKVYLGSGEWAGAGTPIVELLDVSRWLVKTNNVGELQIDRVRSGQEVLIKVNAIPGETLRGRVDTISPDAVVQQGDTTYTLTIELEPTNLNLRPGMTTQVEIITQ